jgi:pimeloyl-ACP methyl ester carboxylesterase
VQAGGEPGAETMVRTVEDVTTPVRHGVPERRHEEDTMPTIQLDDGVHLAYEEAGSGAPPLLFVHGWAGNRSHLAPQFAHFAARHRVVAVDRRGHGESDAPVQEYTVEQAADDLAALCRELGLGRAVVVQHSFDRLAFDFATRYPELVLALAVIDGPTLAGEAFDAAARGFLAGLQSDQWREAIRGFAEQVVFPPGMPEAAKEATLDQIATVPRHVLVSTWQGFVDYPAEPAVAALRCPLLYVGGSMPADLHRLRELCPQVEVAELRGRGHFVQLTDPTAVNEILAAFVARVGQPAAAG